MFTIRMWFKFSPLSVRPTVREVSQEDVKSDKKRSLEEFILDHAVNIVNTFTTALGALRNLTDQDKSRIGVEPNLKSIIFTNFLWSYVQAYWTPASERSDPGWPVCLLCV